MTGRIILITGLDGIRYAVRPQSIGIIHDGSLPRPKSLLDVILAKEEGRPVDAAAFEAQSDAAVARRRACSFLRR